jgi:hypothetical protein
MVGVSYKDSTQTTVDTVFLYLVEAASKHNVIKLYGGRQVYVADGHPTKTQVFFPTKEQDIEVMPEPWTPTATDGAVNMPGVVVKVVPATRYECAHCGVVRHSEYPYPSMWCSCSHKAYPCVGAVAEAERMPAVRSIE